MNLRSCNTRQLRLNDSKSRQSLSTKVADASDPTSNVEALGSPSSSRPSSSHSRSQGGQATFSLGSHSTYDRHSHISKYPTPELPSPSAR